MNRAAVMAPMDAAARTGKLALQSCGACNATQYPPRELCQICLATDLIWTIADDVAGEVLATTTLHHSNEPSTKLPVRIGLIRLDAGPSVVCFIPHAEPTTRVRLTARLDPMGRTILEANP